jgi:hypothetical protein
MTRTDLDLQGVACSTLRAFGDLTTKWHSEPEDSPNRDRYAVARIADVVARVDVVATEVDTAPNCSRSSGLTSAKTALGP